MLVFGRTTYQGMAEYWTKAEEQIEIAGFMNGILKVFCSSTPKTAGWNNTIIVKDAVAEIPELKRQGDGDMYVFGSADLSGSLMNAELFDEFRLYVVPVLLGKGKLLFPRGITHQKLQPFLDGNERTALVAGLIFLEFNGISIDDPYGGLYSMMIKTASGKGDKEYIAGVLRKLSVE